MYSFGSVQSWHLQNVTGTPSTLLPSLDSGLKLFVLSQTTYKLTKVLEPWNKMIKFTLEQFGTLFKNLPSLDAYVEGTDLVSPYTKYLSTEIIDTSFNCDL